MKISPIPFHHNGFFIFDSISLLRYFKKHYKGSTVAYLKPFQRNSQVVNSKFLKRLELMSLDFLFNNQDKMPPSLKLLRHTKNTKKLALHHLIKEDNDIYLIYKMLKRYKIMTSLELNTINRSEKITDVGLYWLRKILRLQRNIRELTYSGLRQNMSESGICNAFSILPRLKLLKKINLELCLTAKFLKALDTLCSILSLCPNLKSVSLNIKYYDTIYEDIFKSIFGPLMKVNYLRQVSIYLGSYTYRSNQPSDLTESLAEFLNKNTHLEVFSLDIRLDKPFSLYFPLEKAKGLRKLVFSLQESKCLTDENFETLLGNIQQCKNLEEFSLNISRCKGLTDLSIKKLCEALVSLPKLAILNLAIGDKIVETTHLSAKTFEYLSEVLSKFQQLSDLDLNLSNFPHIKEAEIDKLFQGISENNRLKKVKLDLCYCLITDRAFQGLPQNLVKLTGLETFELDLYSCKFITSEFLDYLCLMLLEGKSSFKNLHKIIVTLTGTEVTKEQAMSWNAVLKKNYPKCYFSFYIRPLTR